MSALRVVIVDDEPLARETLRYLLASDASVHVAGECSGIDAAEVIARERPDILFLDVQMPEVDGFQVLQAVGPASVPAVVFVTAYDDYALRAFEVHALDYLLKPFDDRRFALALERAKEAARSKRVDERLVKLLDGHAKRFFVRTREKVLLVRPDEIDWVEAADYYVSLHVGGKTHLLRETMNEIEQQLDPERFFRVHRSAIVNVERVRELHPLFRGDCVLILHDGTRLKLSRARREAFEKMLR